MLADLKGSTMILSSIAEAIIDWGRIPASHALGTVGSAHVRAYQAGSAQVRLVEYGPGYLADHWCTKGHIIYVLSGELLIEHENGQDPCRLQAGMSWCVGDDEGPPHRVCSAEGATIFIID
jgi:hypothetical protein